MSPRGNKGFPKLVEGKDSYKLQAVFHKNPQCSGVVFTYDRFQRNCQVRVSMEWYIHTGGIRS